jgi:serine/threonine protein kinase
VIHFFRANGTAYMVMEYKPGDNLQHYINKRGGNLSEKFILTLFPPLLDGLALVHEYGLLHLDIKPGNIHVLPGGVPLLLDFGALHRLHTSRRYQPKQVITAGFSAPEQHDEDGYVGPWSDLYSIGATMRACIEGKSPPPSTLRREKDKLRPAADQFKRRYTPGLLEIIDWAMEVDPLLRPQSVAEFQAALSRLEAPVENVIQSEGVFARLVSNFPWRRAGGEG